LAILVWGWRASLKKRWNFPSIAETLMMCFVRIVFLHYFRRRLHKQNGATELQVALQSFLSFQFVPIANANYSFFLNLLAVNRHQLSFWKHFICYKRIVKTMESEIIWRKPVNLFRFRPCQVTGIFWLKKLLWSILLIPANNRCDPVAKFCACFGNAPVSSFAIKWRTPAGRLTVCAVIDKEYRDARIFCSIKLQKSLH
jgi:hypothetical protein